MKIHKDKLGVILKVGDIVAYPSYNYLKIGRITKLNPKMLAITDLERNKPNDRVYSEQAIKLDSAETMIWVLANSK